MASTYSNLKIQLMATGENSGTWGNVTNDNLGIAIEQAITGSVDVTVSSDTTLSLTDTNAAQNARALRLNIGGSGGFNLTVPSIQKLYLVNNGTLGAVVVKNASGSTVTVPTAKTMWVYSTGSGVVDAVTHLSSLTLGSALPIASGGTGSTSTTFANLQTNVVGTLPIANGGTGSASTTYANLQTNVVGTLPVANGGTGSASATFSGANITSLNASSVSSGTLDMARLGTAGAPQFGSLGVGTAASGTTGEIRATNNVTAFYSDERLKTKTGNIENALDKVCQIETMLYHANEVAVALGYDASIQEVGVTAQSVQKVQPEIVVSAPIDDKYLTVRYEKLIPLLIEAIKELKTELDQLKNK